MRVVKWAGQSTTNPQTRYGVIIISSVTLNLFFSVLQKEHLINILYINDYLLLPHLNICILLWPPVHLILELLLVYIIECIGLIALIYILHWVEQRCHDATLRHCLHYTALAILQSMHMNVI